MDSFVTLVAAVLDPAAHTATLVNAGHPSPLLARRATRAVEPAIPTEVAGPPLGVLDGHDYASRQVRLEEGDGLVLFSDGVTEALDAAGHSFGAAGMRAVLAERAFSAVETGERLIGAVRRHAAGCGQHDDIALVCFGRAGV
jgi:serine phosphatase RsbU (regulator of sigma subunit)